MGDVAGWRGGCPGTSSRCPIALRCAASRRSDVRAHPICENAHPMQSVHRDSMREALGDLPTSHAE
eukprot:3608139-Pyramimonas_sp.AAC.1